jgi:hypothetical protein
MIKFLPQSAINIFNTMNEMIAKYHAAFDKNEFCDPNEPLIIMVNGKKHFVLSIGGDPNEKGLILEAKPISYWN